MDERLRELELRFTEQQELLQQLSEVVYAQGRELDAVKAELSRVKEKVGGDPGLVDSKDNEPPPHY